MPHKDPVKHAEYHRQYREKNRETLRTKHRVRYREVYHVQHKAHLKQRRQQEPEHFREKELVRKYGLTLEDYNRMLVAQGGVCAVCRNLDYQKDGKIRPLSVDHNHSTNQVRGLLCLACNMAVGYLKDEPLLAEAVARYLRLYQHG